MSKEQTVWTVGGYGYTVAVALRPNSPNYHLRWSENGKPKYKSTYSDDLEVAQKAARRMSARFLAGDQVEKGAPLTLGVLFQRYRSEVSSRKTEKMRKDDENRMDLLERFFGVDRQVDTLDRNDVARYVSARKGGRVGKKWGPVTDTAVGHDLARLKSICKWATETKMADGRPLLDRNPLAGQKRLLNAHPERRVATMEWYEAVRAECDAIDAFLGPGLDLLEASGWRASTVFRLRGCDIRRKGDEKAPRGRIKKWGEGENKGREAWVPMSRAVRAAVDALPLVIGDGPLFPLPWNEKEPWTYDYAKNRAIKACEAAERPWLGFHSLRRKWATERKHHPLKDVQAAGGWKTPTMVLQYQAEEDESVLRVMEEPRKRRESK